MKCWRYLKLVWGTFPLLHIFGVPVRMHTTYLLFPVGFWLALGWLAAGGTGLLMALGLIAAFLPSMLVHEFAHVITAARFGIATQRVVLLPVGCVALLEEIPTEVGEILVASAGPAASALLALLGWTTAQMAGAGKEGGTIGVRFWLDNFCLLNTALCVFNLLPCFPMDGGRVLRGVLTILVALVCPRRAAQAVLIASRIAIRYVAWPIALGMIGLTIAVTHLWTHLLIFLLVPLLGEAELLVLKESSPYGRAPVELGFLPVLSRCHSRWQLGLRLSPWKDIMTIEETAPRRTDLKP